MKTVLKIIKGYSQSEFWDRLVYKRQLHFKLKLCCMTHKQAFSHSNADSGEQQAKH
jgi:hypothetical protein